MNINENMIKQTKNLSDSDKGEIRKIKVVRRAGHDDSLSVSGRLRWEARVSGWAGLQRKTLLLPIQIKKPQKRTKKGGWAGGLELLHQLVRAYCAHLSPDLCSKL